MGKIIFLLTVLIALTNVVYADSSYSKQEKMQYRRAVEAVVWGMPVINFLSMKNGFMETAGVDYNDVIYHSRIQNWKLRVTTPNNTTPYAMAFWNVSDGPVVIEIPASTEGVSLFGTFMDAWQRPIADVGARGRDQGHGARYLLLPDSYQGERPEGYITVTQKTFNGWMLLRPVIADTSEESLKKAQEFVKNIHIYPFNKRANKPETRYVDAYDIDTAGVPPFDGRTFELLHQALQEERTEEKDMVMMGMLHSLGIEKGKPFEPTEGRKQIFNAAAEEAHSYLVDTYFNSGLTPTLWGSDSQWSILVPKTAIESVFSWQMPGYLDIDGRGATYFALFSSAEEFDLHNPPTMYLLSNKDTSGRQLNGSNSYRLNVPKDVPIEQFWSALVYELKDASWFDEVAKYGVSSIDRQLEVNSDGSVDVYFGPEPPAGKEANWAPTVAGEDYFIYFRLYRPTSAFFKGRWLLGGIEQW